MFKYFNLRSTNVINKGIIRNYQSNNVYGYKLKKKNSFQISSHVLEARQQQSNLYRWIEAYKAHGHRLATINPVQFQKVIEEEIPELDPSRYGLNINSSVEYNLDGLITSIADRNASTKQIQDYLNDTYCGNVGIEISHLESEEEKEWLTENYEQILKVKLDQNAEKEIAELLLKSQVWDNFLATKFPTVKRYGGEGAETILAFFRQIFIQSAEADIKNIVLGMPHRGRLNLLTTMLHTRPAKMFRKFKGLPEFPSDAKAMCDIASHFHTSEDFNINGKLVRLSMPHNPSHLEAVNPVSMGKTRSKQQSLKDGPFNGDHEAEVGKAVLNLQLHGDAAFAGQGINQECLMMTATPNFEIGGTIHMIVNNQIGFTTPGDRGRNSRYCSDLAKSINAPIFHVNGNDPEALTLITQLAFNYQRKFKKDIFIDLNCFRRWGHNELDDPTVTNPSLYEIIHNRNSIPDLYVEKLVKANILDQDAIDNIRNSHLSYLNDELQNYEKYEPEKTYFERQWTGIIQAGDNVTLWDTGLDYSLLSYIGKSSVYYPDNFNIHPHLLKTHVNARHKRLTEGKNIDWATAEALAFGSLMYQGHNVRLSGEDVGRGTFAHRHAMIVDQKTNEIFIPLNSMDGGLGGKFEVANSILSEEAVLGFEYGMAIDNPNNLIVWEAQFGDFFNGAQIIIDTFIASGETKWMICNGLVMLLPHGYDGAASEHSSCRIERFLQMTDSKENTPDADDINMQVINPTTPAQYFHALRRQIIRNYRKPLVVVAPKILLRLSDCASTYTDFEPGTLFKPVLPDTIAEPKSVKKVILCSGKHYYNLNNERNQRKLGNVAIIRVESLVPFPVHELSEELNKYKSATEFIWSQEEHRNMGAWTFIQPRFENMLGRRIKYFGRSEAATIAVGVSSWHQKEVAHVVHSPFQ